MGCGYSGDFLHAFNSVQFQEWNKTYKALKISKNELSQLFKKFKKVDLDGGGTIDVVELLTVIDVERTPFSERVFSIFDEDKSGKIDFNEFVLSLWNYCTLSRATLCKIILYFRWLF
jgi:Ca2+-binding EF-hand superfamily protein